LFLALISFYVLITNTKQWHQNRVCKGTRDFFSPTLVAKRQYIIQIIKVIFEKFGFNLSRHLRFAKIQDTLMGKYGEEGDQLIFKILNSGDYWRKPMGCT
jgi:histidyl-tRNA synthetase